MHEIVLTDGSIAFVDDDFAWLDRFEWFPQKVVDSTLVYAVAQVSGRRTIMHRLILVADPSVQVDHRDCNGLNNCRDNLRICTNTQNQQNRRKIKARTSKFKGVFRCSDRPGWRRTITVNGRETRRDHKTALAAALEYDRLAVQHFGEFARVNFPEAVRTAVPVS